MENHLKQEVAMYRTLLGLPPDNFNTAIPSISDQSDTILSVELLSRIASFLSAKELVRFSLALPQLRPVSTSLFRVAVENLSYSGGDEIPRPSEIWPVFQIYAPSNDSFDSKTGICACGNCWIYPSLAIALYRLKRVLTNFNLVSYFSVCFTPYSSCFVKSLVPLLPDTVSMILPSPSEFIGSSISNSIMLLAKPVARFKFRLIAFPNVAEEETGVCADLYSGLIRRMANLDVDKLIFWGFVPSVERESYSGSRLSRSLRSLQFERWSADAYMLTQCCRNLCSLKISSFHSIKSLGDALSIIAQPKVTLDLFSIEIPLFMITPDCVTLRDTLNPLFGACVTTLSTKLFLDPDAQGSCFAFDTQNPNTSTLVLLSKMARMMDSFTMKRDIFVDGAVETEAEVLFDELFDLPNFVVQKLQWFAYDETLSIEIKRIQ
ncbi:hypothetical protein HDU78_003675 [Chytriomyces hyalinus]|nr:hypothetical protein HDU78_003675 [Chytriomyces hyalinus]